MDTRLALMAGTDIPIPPCRLVLHQPSIKEISYLGEEDFFIGVQTLTLHKSMFIQQGKDNLENITNFQIFMTVMNERQTADKKICVQQVLSLFFPKNNVLFAPRSLIFQNEDEMITVDENNFDSLQDAIRLVCCSKNGPMDQQSFNPGNSKAKEIADKLMRGRQRVAAQKGDNNSSILSRYVSILTIGLESMSLQDLLNCTIYQLYDLIERYSLYINWDLDIRSRLAGGKPDSKPDDWMKNLHQ